MPKQVTRNTQPNCKSPPQKKLQEEEEIKQQQLALERERERLERERLTGLLALLGLLRVVSVIRGVASFVRARGY